MNLKDLHSDLTKIKNDSSLFEEGNFESRANAIDLIEFQILDYIDDLLNKSPEQQQLITLRCNATETLSQLKEIDNTLIVRLQSLLRSHPFTGSDFRNLIAQFNLSDPDHRYREGEPGYDNLDIFINRLFAFQSMPEPVRELEPEMVFYQKTPARFVFELVDKIQFTKDDSFFDLGAGLGQVAILVGLLTGLPSRGVEFDDALCGYAKQCAAALSLTNVTFINADARHTDYSEGTVFFMYTPFTGGILQTVLEVLRRESLQRRITIITYGPCTPQVGLAAWLTPDLGPEDSVKKLHIFTSR